VVLNGEILNLPRKCVDGGTILTQPLV
jgi:hypothetical protein